MTKINVNELSVSKFIDPDKPWTEFAKANTFIYNNNKLYLAKEMRELGFDGRRTHIDMLLASKELRRLYSKDLAKKSLRDLMGWLGWHDVYFNKARKYRMSGLKETLFGRCVVLTKEEAEDFMITKASTNIDTDNIENGINFVSFWNTDSAIFQRDLSNCLKALFDKGIMNKDIPTILSTPVHKTININKISGLVKKELSDEEKREIEMRQQLHLADPIVKKQLMQQLGQWSPGKETKKPEWERELRKLGYGGYTTIGDSQIPTGIMSFKEWLYNSGN